MHKLLEQAAQAAGIEFGIIHGTPHVYSDAGWTPWNPLEDDGDAFRLAVGLGISLELDASIQTDVNQFQGSAYGDYATGVEAWWVNNTGKVFVSRQVYNDNPAECVRLAVVETAAQMC
jgi:hypothetical protein